MAVDIKRLTSRLPYQPAKLSWKDGGVRLTGFKLVSVFIPLTDCVHLLNSALNSLGRFERGHSSPRKQRGDFYCQGSLECEENSKQSLRSFLFTITMCIFHLQKRPAVDSQYERIQMMLLSLRNA